MSENTVKLTKKDLMGVMIRFSFFPMVTINYERFQTLQYFCALSHVLEKLYPEMDAQVRFKYIKGATLYAYCNKHGLWMSKVDKL